MPFTYKRKKFVYFGFVEQVIPTYACEIIFCKDCSTHLGLSEDQGSEWAAQLILNFVEHNLILKL